MFLVFLKFLGWLRYNWVGSQMVKTVPSIFIYALKLLPHRSPFLNYQTGHASGTPHLSRRGRGECCWVDDVEQDPSFWMPHISSARQLLHSQFTWRFCRSFLVLSSRHWRSSSVSRIVGFMGGNIIDTCFLCILERYSSVSSTSFSARFTPERKIHLF